MKAVLAEQAHIINILPPQDVSWECLLLCLAWNASHVTIIVTAGSTNQMPAMSQLRMR